jgi:hypothetical protein
MNDSHDEFRHKIIGHWCTYCGDNAEEFDHFPPRAVTNYGLLVPCCRECNSHISTLYAFSFKDRSLLAKDKIRKKYSKLLRIPEWDEEELNDMAPHMRDSVLDGQRIQEIIKQRLAWDSWSYLKGIDIKNDIERVVVEIDLILGNMKREFDRSERLNKKNDQDLLKP